MTFYDGYLFTTLLTACVLLLAPALHKLTPWAFRRFLPDREAEWSKQTRNLLVKGLCIGMYVLLSPPGYLVWVCVCGGET